MSEKFATPLRLRGGLLVVAVAAVAAVAAAGCAHDRRDEATAAAVGKYPRRGPGCELALYHTPVPGVPTWDDLGVAEATCSINESPAECLRLLRAEACRMGGDIIYNVPRRPLRPRDQLLLYRGQVAHSQARQPKEKDDTDPPPAAPIDEALGPVVPLPSAGDQVQPATAVDPVPAADAPAPLKLRAPDPASPEAR